MNGVRVVFVPPVFAGFISPIRSASPSFLDIYPVFIPINLRWRRGQYFTFSLNESAKPARRYRRISKNNWEF